MTELIDRYVSAVAERLPGDTRDDVARELRATIDDMLDARGGTRDEDDVRAVLSDLGDPARLAAGYRTSPRWLVGPDYYDHWSTTLKAILAVALPVIFGVQVVFADWSSDRGVVSLVLGAVGGTLEVAVHIAVWTTLVFVVLERTGTPAVVEDEPEAPWQPDDLPEPAARRQITLGDFIASVVILALIPAGLLWQHHRSAYEGPDGSIPLFDPDLWSAWFPALLVLVALNLALEVAKFIVGRWTARLTGVNVAFNLVFFAFFALLIGTQDVWNPPFVDALEADVDFRLDESPILPLSLLGIGLICLWDIVDCLRGYRKASASAAQLA